MRTALWLLLVFATSAAFASQVVWKWVDDNGVTHYSDRPVPGATRIELNVGTSDKSGEPAARPSPAASTPSAPTRAADGGPPYDDFQISAPDQNETIPNTGGQVTVQVRIRPGLRPGHTLNLYLDGKHVEGYSGNATSFALKEVPRGEHSVVATIVDVGDRRIQETSPVTFFVRQTSISQPPVGPALRPSTKPRTGGTANKLPTKQPSVADLSGARAPIDPRTNAPIPPQAAPKPVPKPEAPTRS